MKAVGYSKRHMMTLLSRLSFGIRGEGRDSIFCAFGVQGAAGFLVTFWNFWAGGTVFLGWAPEVTWQVISQHRIARIEGSPAQYRDMLRSSDPSMFDLSSLRLAVTAGSVIPPKLVYDIRSKLCATLLNVYGSTEAGLVSLGLALPGDPFGSSGRVTPWVKAEVVDENDRVLPAGQEGMLRFNCEDMPHAYMNDPRANELHFRGKWFYSGDMGTISSDRILTLSGRSSEHLNAGGVKVSPFTIENHVAAFPGISECAVFGASDEFGLESIYAAVVADGPVDIPALQAYCASALGAKAPTNFLQMPALPRNAAGKVSRADLAQIASAQTRKGIGH